MSRPHTVVIGSGPNGLSAAIRLAEAGWPTCLVEAEDRIGGAVATQELTLPGFLHDTFSSVYPQGAASPTFGRMPLERHGLRWSHPEACMSHVLDGGRAVVLHRDLQRTAASLEHSAPGDGEHWSELVGPMLEHFPALRDAMLSGFPPLRPGLRALATVPPGALLQLAKLVPQRARRFARDTFTGTGNRAWLYGMGAHSVDPMTRGSALAGLYLGLVGMAVGWPSPVGGAGSLASALHDYFVALGGRVRTGSAVVRVVHERGRVRGVRLADGTDIPCSVVIADVLPGALVRMAGDGLPLRYRRALRSYRLGPATFKVDWALDGAIPWESEQTCGAGTVHVGGDEGDLLDRLREGLDRIPHRPFMLLGQQSLADPTRAPEGCHTAWAYTHGPRDADWASCREELVDRMEREVERYAPGFRSRILARHVATPRWLEEHDRNIQEGDLGAGSYDLRQLVFRPLVEASPYRTPLRGLYLGSAATFPGGGVHGTCGDAAAQAAIADARGPLAATAGRLLASAYA